MPLHNSREVVGAASFQRPQPAKSHRFLPIVTMAPGRSVLDAGKEDAPFISLQPLKNIGQNLFISIDNF